MGVVVRRYDVCLINLDPTIGSEVRKSRPCLVISPDELNQAVRTVIVAPMTTKGRSYPTRIHCRFQDKEGQVVLDQIRTVDKKRLIRKLGQLDEATHREVRRVLREMFAE